MTSSNPPAYPPRGRVRQQRRSIAVEAARLISESGLRDYQQAKRKAAADLGIAGEPNFPDNVEVQQALREHQRLFYGNSQPQTLRRWREAAREALRFFSTWEPRLVGPVLDGSADEQSAVCLHLHTDDAVEVARFLREHAIPYREKDRRLRLTRTMAADFPAFLFAAGDVPIDLTVLPYDRVRQAPLDRSGTKPMRRATLRALEKLISAP
ncbi:MAG: hypothetical protein WBV61_11575 [Rhodanobacteraceae bacterium]